MIRSKQYQELISAIRSISILNQEIEYRPCFVNGKKAIFHRWVNTANPALPRGVSAESDKARFFQHRSTHGLVEFPDGAVVRVWPQEIRFADSDRFAWLEDSK